MFCDLCFDFILPECVHVLYTVLVYKSLSKKEVVHKFIPSYGSFLSKDPQRYLGSKDGHILVFRDTAASFKNYALIFRILYYIFVNFVLEEQLNILLPIILTYSTILKFDMLTKMQKLCKWIF